MTNIDHLKSKNLEAAMDSVYHNFCITTDKILGLLESLGDSKENTTLLNQASKLIRDSHSAFQANRSQHSSNVELIKNNLITREAQK